MRHIFTKKNRALVGELVRTDFKLRYQGSVLGYAWSLLRPLLLFAILYVVFVKFLKLGTGIEHYPIYLLLGIVLWNFFIEMTSQSLSSIVGRGDLIRKIKIPRWIIVLSSSFSALISLGLNLLVVFVFMLINHTGFMKTGLLLPLVVAEIYIFALGISLFLAAAYVKYRDISYIWEVVTQALFYLTPIIYPLSLVPNLTIQKLILLNPIAQAIQDARQIIVTGNSLTVTDVYSGNMIRIAIFGIVVAVLIVGVLYFKRESKFFAENL